MNLAEDNTPRGYAVEYRGYGELQISIGTHNGGAFSSSVYIVHFTEQEMLGIIRAQLEAAGLNFGTTPPEHSIRLWDSYWNDDWGVNPSPKIGLDLFDEENGVAIARLDFQESHHAATHRFGWISPVAAPLAERFAEQISHTVGVFYTPTQNFGAPQRWCRETEISIAVTEPTAEEMAAARPQLMANLTLQVREFISYLQSEGILEGIPSPIGITINGISIESDVSPMFIDHQVLVPFRAVFEAIGFEVDWIVRQPTGIATATNENLDIRIELNQGRVTVNGNNLWLVGSSLLLHNGRTMVPMNFIAEATGATVEWDNDMRTIIITSN